MGAGREMKGRPPMWRQCNDSVGRTRPPQREKPRRIEEVGNAEMVRAEVQRSTAWHSRRGVGAGAQHDEEGVRTSQMAMQTYAGDGGAECRRRELSGRGRKKESR